MTKVATLKLCGILNEPPPQTVPLQFWTDGLNMVPRAGLMVRKDKATAYAPAGLVKPAYGLSSDKLQSTFLAATATYFYGGSTSAIGTAYIAKVHSVDAGLGTSTDRTPAGWSNANAYHIWSGCRLNNTYYVLNTCGEFPVFWDFSAALAAGLVNWLGGTGSASRCQALRSYREFLVAIGVNHSVDGFQPDSVYWSDAAPGTGGPATWTAGATNLAGSAILQGPGGYLVDGLILRETFYLYKRGAVWAMNRVNNTSIFKFDLIFDCFGALATNCIASDGQFHYVLTGSDVIRHDGVSYESLLTARNRAYLGTVNVDTKARLAFCYFNKHRHELHVCLPVGGFDYCDRDIVINLLTGEQTIMTPPGGIGSSMFEESSTGVSRSNLLLDINGTRFVRMEDPSGGNSDAGATFAPSLTRAGLLFGPTPDSKSKICWIRPRVSAPDGAVTLTVEVASTANPDDTLSYGTARTFATASNERVHFDQQIGRFHSVRFSTSGGLHWAIEGFDVGYDELGTD